MKTALALLALPLVLHAADPWKSRKAADWSAEDAARVLTDSPWAKSVSLDGDLGPMGGPGGWPPPGGPEGGPGGDASARFLIRWESAAPIRAAAARTPDPHHGQLAPLFAKYYVVSLSLAPESRRAAGRAPTPLSVLAGLAESATLSLKGQDPLAPEKIESLETGSFVTTVFLFPRSNAIGLSHKDATFEAKLGNFTLKARFPIKDMLWEGAPSL